MGISLKIAVDVSVRFVKIDPHGNIVDQCTQVFTVPAILLDMFCFGDIASRILYMCHEFLRLGSSWQIEGVNSMEFNVAL